MNWISQLVTAAIALLVLLVGVGMKRPRLCLQIADSLKPLFLGATFGSVIGLVGLVTARAIMLGAIEANHAALIVGGEKAVNALRTCLDSAVGIWTFYAVAPMVIFGVLAAAGRFSEMVLEHDTKVEPGPADHD
ncbi:hypothetical protein G9274_002578 [Stenotrophomonas rhizophila]|nr:hypothetical protein G9274_002578 [Stenotrophomonas rhizophila]